MSRFATGVAVVTARAPDGTRHGMTVNSFTSVSLDPPLLLVCLTTGARSTEAVTGAGRFAVSFLSARQQHIALRFARRGEDHFAGLPADDGEHSLPVVPGALAHLVCDVDRHLVAGDHVVVVGRVREMCDRPGEPLAFFGGRFTEVALQHEEAPLWSF
ncbi:flavin reductase family protein [Streptomyces sp. DT24]